MRLTADCDIFAAFAMLRFDQCVLCSGAVSKVRVISTSTCSSVIPPRSPRPRFVRQALRPRGPKPFPPVAHGLVGDAQLPCHLAVLLALGAAQNTRAWCGAPSKRGISPRSTCCLLKTSVSVTGR